MNINVDTRRVPKLVEKLNKTKEGRLAMLLDEMIYAAVDVSHPHPGMTDTKLWALWAEVPDKTEGWARQDTKKVLREIRDYLYQLALEGML